ncbi:hypothetical protein DM860_018057 [Cuscuta australis]|uniref:Uncharacterized protein n=1 Tax=Cuscuta australis TaxID=267555 RepID=A0A328DA68_9ASTE|nr:hypothetical protein DM860_018057 [Cuscuta australis]
MVDDKFLLATPTEPLEHQPISPTPLLELGTPTQHTQNSETKVYDETQNNDKTNHSSTKDNITDKGGSEGFTTAPLTETTLAERQMITYEGKGEPECSDSYTELFPPLPRRMLSPYAPAFLPLSNNTFAALLNQDPGSLEEEDPFSKINDQNLVLCSNAVEDHAKERDGPILYTHSEGEDLVFIDSKLKPLKIDLSRCFKQPFNLRKELKGRKTFSPSQIVTRSKAKILEEGRRITPIGWEEEQEMLDPQQSHEEEVIEFFKLCCPSKKEEPKASKKPLSKSQKKKLKKKKKQS